MRRIHLIGPYTGHDALSLRTFAPKCLLPDIVTAAGFKQTRPLFAAIKLV
jgi:hypothetical protein